MSYIRINASTWGENTFSVAKTLIEILVSSGYEVTVRRADGVSEDLLIGFVARFLPDGEDDIDEEKAIVMSENLTADDKE